MITYAIFLDEQGREMVALNVNTGEVMTTGFLPRNHADLPEFLKSGEVGETFDENGNLIDDSDVVDDFGNEDESD